MTHKDPEKARAYQREYQKKWRAKNPEKVAAIEKRSREKHAGAGKLRQRRYRQAKGAEWSARAKRWWKGNPERTWRQYGIEITLDQYAQLWLAQNGACKICRQLPKAPITRLSVDHCHTTGRVRGLLCSRCNSAIGMLDDSPALTLAAAEYLVYSLEQ